MTDREIRKERSRLRDWQQFARTLCSTLRALIVVAALAVLTASLWLPVLRIYGTSMEPALSDGQIVLAVKTRRLSPGDIAAFYHGNQLLVKRCIAKSADWVIIDGNGNVTVNGVFQEELYLTERSFGQTNIAFPYQVPDGRYFVMGDERETSVDSRNSAVGSIAQERIVGKVIFRIWPLRQLGPIK